MTTSQSKRYQIAIDAGGTMTDCVLVDKDGEIVVGKALSNKVNEAESYMESVANASEYINTASSEVHEGTAICTYAGTTMLNILLTLTGQKVGLLTTKGFEHVLYMERALTWLHLSYDEQMRQSLHEHTPSVVDVRNVKPVAERIKGPSYYPGAHIPAGSVLVPLREEDVRKGVEELIDAGVQVIGILFIHSYVNPAHESRAAEIAREIIQQRGADVRVVLSYEVCPVSMESQRAKSLMVQCFAALPAQAQLLKVEQAAKSDGFAYELTTFLSYGASVNVRYHRMYESLISGPAGGLIGAQYFLNEINNIDSIICTDLGGTSYDVGVITKGLTNIEAEPVFAGHKMNLPMLAIDSIGAGTGTLIHVDTVLKRVELGPESAGSMVGTCYKYPDITIGDLDLILGYLNPEYFLGGAIKLDKERALFEVTERLAKPLGQDVYEASSRVLDTLHSKMRDHISGTMIARGGNINDFTLFAYGGSGPLHMWGVSEGLNVRATCTVPWAAAFSAFGVAAADYFHNYQKSVLCVLAAAMSDDAKLKECEALNQAWQELEEKAYVEMEAEGFSRDNVSFRYGIYARYIGQMASWYAPVPSGRIGSIEDMDKVIIDSFEQAYTSIYPLAARMPESGYAVTVAVVQSYADKRKPTVRIHELSDKEPSKEAHKGKRAVFFEGEWSDWDVWEMDPLKAGNHIIGPAIIEHPMTTVVIPPRKRIEIDPYMIMWFK